MGREKRTRAELIAEIEQLERRLRDAELVRNILAHSSQPFAVGSQDGRLTEVNQAFCDLTGYSRDELLDDVTWNERLTPPEWRERSRAFLQRVLSSTGPERFEKEYLRKGGERIAVELLVQVFPGETQPHLCAFVTDITARRRAEQARTRSERRYRHLVEDLPSGVVHVSAKGEVKLANKEAQRILGVSYDEMTQRYVHDWEGETLREDGSVCPVEEYPVSRCLATGEAQPAQVIGVRRPDGEVSWAIFSAKPEREDGTLAGAVVAFRDITEWRRAEDTVRALSATVDQSPVSVMMADRDGTILYVNDAFCASTGYAPEEVIGKTPRILQSGVHPKSFYEELWNTVLAGQIWRNDICNRRKDGELYWELMSIAPVRSRDGEIRQFVAMRVDDTERRAAEKALEESEDRFRVVTQTAYDPIVALDEQDRITVWNPAAERVFGYGVQDALGCTLGELGVVDESLLRGQANADDTASGDTIEATATRRNGTSFPAEISIATIQRDNGVSRTVIVRDATERKRLEGELVRVSKLESVGVLAGGIAHDFNNLLTGILANLSLASRKVEGGTVVRELLDAAGSAAQRATGLTRQLLTFSKGGAPVKQLMSVTGLGEAAAFVLRGSNVRCEAEFDADLWSIEGDEGQLQQAIQNLAINAQQAMPSGGTLSVRGTNRRLRHDDVPPLAAGDYVHIRVSDQGEGIAPHLLDRVFDPYFTTKEQGSGLGLATVFSVLKNHHGHVTVESPPGGGTTFHLYLPASHADPLEAADAAVPAPMAPGRILLMDDDPTVLAAAAAGLKGAGFSVETTRDGEAAVDAYRRAEADGTPFDAVMVDLTVPGGMGGVATLAALKELHPCVAVIVSSGYSDDPVMAEPERFGFCGVVAKPYTIDTLTQTVSTCVARVARERRPGGTDD